MSPISLSQYLIDSCGVWRDTEPVIRHSIWVSYIHEQVYGINMSIRDSKEAREVGLVGGERKVVVAGSDVSR